MANTKPSADDTAGKAVEDNAGDVNAAAAPAESGPDYSTINGVKYVGPYDVRILTNKDLRTLGVNSPQGALRWDAANGKVAPKTDMNDETITALLALSEFKAV